MWDFVTDKSGAGAGFLRELRFVSLANLHSICFSTTIFTITSGWHNRPRVAAVPIASQTKIKKKNATSRKVPGSIPDGVIVFFSIDLILPATLMALESTQPLTEMSIRNHPGDKWRPARKADNLTAICEPIV
jgi:hypothetical protein